MYHIYVIEDDENIRTLIKIALSNSGYEVSDFENAEDALANILNDKPDLAIFDVMLPQMDGLTAVKKIRQMSAISQMSIMMLTAKDSEIDKVLGLDGGADDYMTKPFGVLELTARIRSLLRRCKSKQIMSRDNIISFNNITINTSIREVKKNDIPLELTFKEYELLIYLIDNKNRVVSRDELLDKIWGVNFVSETRTLDMHIRTLRQKLDDSDHSCIKTIRGVGYRFIVD